MVAPTQATGKTISSTAKASVGGLMANVTKASIIRTREKAPESSPGLTGASTMENGFKTSSTALECTQMLMVRRRKAYGTWERFRSGSSLKSCIENGESEVYQYHA